MSVCGIVANTYSVFHNIKNFDIKKTVFKLLLFDSIVSALVGVTQLIINVGFLILPRSDLICSMLLITNNVANFHGVLVALEIASIRYKWIF